MPAKKPVLKGATSKAPTLKQQIPVFKKFVASRDAKKKK